MTTDQLNKIRATLRYIVELLVEGNYQGLYDFTNGAHLTALQIRDAIRDYGKSLVTAPDAAYDNPDVIEVADTEPPRFSVRFDLYTKEEGRSDLSVEMTLVESGGQSDKLECELDGIHVL